MKKFVVCCFISLLTLSLCSCGTETTNVSIDYGKSEIYSNDDMDRAIAVIQEKFIELDGCVLYSLTYAGDEVCKENIEYCNLFDEDANFAECIVFHSSFQSPKNGGGAWEADTEYTWTWFLAKDTDDNWELLTFGY